MAVYVQLDTDCAGESIVHMSVFSHWQAEMERGKRRFLPKSNARIFAAHI
jgi:hypothetical protein